MSIFPFYNKQRKPRGFNHIPIFYDPKKEARKQREIKIKKELGMLKDEDKKEMNFDHIKGSFRDNIPNGSKIKRRNASNVRLVIIICLIVALLYFILYY